MSLPSPHAALPDAPPPPERLPVDDAELADAQRLLRRAVRKSFPASAHGPAGEYSGVIVKARRSKSTGAVLWRVRYEDGDREELEFHELLPILLPAALSTTSDDAPVAALHGAEAGARGSPGRADRFASAPGWATPAPAPRAPQRVAQPVPAGRRYNGVTWQKRQACWRVQYYAGAGKLMTIGDFAVDRAEDAARAWDEVARQHGRLALNFPREGTAEVQAVFQPRKRISTGVAAKRSWPVPQKVQERSAAGQLAPHRIPTKKYVGMSWDQRVLRWRVQIADGAVSIKLGAFPEGQEEAAARCYDAAARELGRTAVNFPIPGSGEVQAVARSRVKQRQSTAGIRAAPLPSLTRRYVGITRDARGGWRVQTSKGGTNVTLGYFPADQAEAAARCYDATARRLGKPVNFPIPGSGEDQAVFRIRPSRTDPPVPGSKRKAPEAAAGFADFASPPAKRPSATPLLLTAGAAADDGLLFTPPEAPEQRLRTSDAAPPPASAQLQSFIRGIEPPLSQPSAVLRAMRDGHVQLAHLQQLARCMGDPSVSDLAVERNLRAAFQQWGVCVAGDQMTLRCALACLPTQR